MNNRDRLIVALDLDNIDDLNRYLEMLAPHVKTFKIGPRLFIPYGKRVIELIKSYNSDIFLDLKLHDIPTQVAESVKRISDLGVQFFTLHALGGRDMIESSRIALERLKDEEKPVMLAVTLLTSFDENDLHFLGFENKINNIVFKLAELALNSGADGLVSSLEEVKELKESINRDFIAVVPGIKVGVMKNRDQKRSGSAQEAFKNGADYIVVGRSIINADNPVDIIRRLLNER